MATRVTRTTADRLMPNGRLNGSRAVAEAIEAYIQRHPHAADSLDGIARWWLGGELANVPPAAVEAAVEELCRRDVLRAETRVSGVVVYRAAGADLGRDDDCN